MMEGICQPLLSAKHNSRGKSAEHHSKYWGQEFLPASLLLRTGFPRALR